MECTYGGHDRGVSVLIALLAWHQDRYSSSLRKIVQRYRSDVIIFTSVFYHRLLNFYVTAATRMLTSVISSFGEANLIFKCFGVFTFQWALPTSSYVSRSLSQCNSVRSSIALRF